MELSRMVSPSDQPGLGPYGPLWAHVCAIWILLGLCCKDGLINRKPVKMHSRSRVRKNLNAKRKGRHMGTGEQYSHTESSR